MNIKNIKKTKFYICAIGKCYIIAQSKSQEACELELHISKVIRKDLSHSK